MARMRQAGAILLGKTNVMVDNPVYGRANNPYNLGYSTTGSSSGEAALIAAGGSPWAWAPIPVVACIANLLLVWGRGTEANHGPGPPRRALPFICSMTDPRTVIGPLARFVEDLALALPILAGVDWKDPSVVPMPLWTGAPSTSRISGLPPIPITPVRSLHQKRRRRVVKSLDF